MHEIMTIEEVAAYLRVSERTVYDWAQKGDLPGGKLGTTWRFKRSEVQRWVDRHLGGTSPAPVPASPNALTLQTILSPERTVLIESEFKKEALGQLARVLSTSPLIGDARELEEAIFKREALMSTGIGCGIGVPHVRLDSVKDLVMALGICKVPLRDYVAIDEVPVQVVCMVAASSTQHPQYIRALSAISSRLKAVSVRQSLFAATSAAAAYRVFAG
ncbi:PTS sugar transporter subunit IIA [Pontiella sp.]|uniref:PTS sugar transporter subunit IIA n=1 Tax=Pontiella sp. TaxID=2837462 RepID=UPI0035668070